MASDLQFAYYSHHKCATGWTTSILQELCFHLGLHHKTAHGPQQYGDCSGLREWIKKEGVEFLAFTNAEIEEVVNLPSHRGFHVVRDPRDVLVSGYFSHKNSHPTEGWPDLMEHRKALRSLSKEEGLLKEMQFSRPFFQAMRSWNYEQDHILEIKMEVLTGDPDAEFRRVLRHLGLYPERGTQTQTSLLHQGRQWANRLTYKLHHELPLPLPRGVTRESSVHRDILASIIDQHRFEKITGGRSKGDEDPESHLRKGEPGDWKRHFTDRVAQAFEKTYGDLVTQLGY